MRLIFPLCILLLMPLTVAAQSVWRVPYQPNHVVLETVAPTYEADRFEGLTGAAFLTATGSITENIEAIAEVPFARAVTSGATTTTLGNPYVGIGLSSTRRPLLVEIGGRLPLASNNVAREATMQTADPGRTAAFGRNERSASLLTNYSFFLSRRTSLRLRAGAVLAAFDTPSGNAETDFRVRYSAQWWRLGDRFGLGLTVTGRAVLSDAGSLGDTSLHHVGTTALVRLGPAHVGVLAGLSLDTVVRDVAPGFLGLTVSTSLGP